MASGRRSNNSASSCMIETIYIEEAVADHPRTAALLARHPRAVRIACERYGEIFNRKAQNFRLQKRRPALILAARHGGRVLPAPARYALGARHNYYFSHMLNCLYDCRYCFLQGMFRSAHYVLFVNYEDFIDDMRAVLAAAPAETIHFFSGYDCDSLALDPVSGFTQAFLPFFETHKKALLELRTKSTQIRALLKRQPLANVIIAFSLTPAMIAGALEHRAPGLGQRLRAMLKLQQAGWQIGLRFDPLIYSADFKRQYAELFERLFAAVDPALTHSVSLGSFRLPRDYFRRIERLYPDEKLFASPLAETEGMVGYRADIRAELLDFCQTRIMRHVPAEKFFPCEAVS